ncbi:protein SET DOMAIN GROUP 41 isoform X1 [Amborella trichopoda]|uniref:protein SET DOMAIN GROUP 41 isoform X1 n=1 Tax=Amborella trichopoda TaxID=13333 RepID=UPI0009C0EC8C|nr:protein SET DOMAIN GROUP 41 isoform X1 [Amborella trichopoda]|eukprot:XP_020527344.1 protein SET DOMAIN GROUP 41 isoform X1 [Amborella trichopoda]
MKLRALQDLSRAQNVISQISPVAASLSDPLLHTRCSSCFSPLSENPSSRFPCTNTCRGSVLYCSLHCLESDSYSHVSSGECFYFHILNSSSFSEEDSCAIRLALRLLHAFRVSAFLDHSRIGGLLTNCHEFLQRPVVNEEDFELRENIRKWARIMRFLRREMVHGIEGYQKTEERENILEEAVLCCVITNGVQVEVGGLVLGSAVYGPLFSWCDHSCRPNACYWFSLSKELDITNDDQIMGNECLHLKPESENAEISNESMVSVRMWSGGGCNSGPSKQGPMITLRTIKPILKDEEVRIAYIDLLQPKAKRHAELWLKYRFICCCDRCTDLSSNYVDCLLQEPNAHYGSTETIGADDFYGKLADFMYQTIAIYLSNGKAEACCEKLENMLAKCQRPGPREASPSVFKLNPIHRLSLDAYITLGSAYRVCAINQFPLSSEKNFQFNKADAAYSLLLAGAVNYLFYFESSLIASAASFWVGAGESLLRLLRNSGWASLNKTHCPSLSIVREKLNLASLSCNCLHLMGFECHDSQNYIERKSSVPLGQLSEILNGFLHCALLLSRRAWSFLSFGCSYLEAIKDPIDFSWLASSDALRHGEIGCWNYTMTDLGLCSERQKGLGGCECEPGSCLEEEKLSLYLLAAHCLIYGKYLMSICNGFCETQVNYISNQLDFTG